MWDGPDHPTHEDPTISKSSREFALALVVAVAAALAVLVLFTGAFTGGGDEGAADCCDKPISASVAPRVASFNLAATTLQEPEGCGADFKRYVVYEGPSSTADVLATCADTTPTMAGNRRAVSAATSGASSEGNGSWQRRCQGPEGWRDTRGRLETAPQVLAVLQRR